MTNELPELVVLTIIRGIAGHLLDACDGDWIQAKQAAVQAIATFNPRNHLEYRLAARIVAYNLHATNALAKACTGQTSEAQAARLRSSALAMTKEADKAEDRLHRLQNPTQEAEPTPIRQAPHRQAPQQPQPEATKPIPPTKRELRAIRLSAQRTGIPFAQALKLFQEAPPLPPIRVAA